MTRAMRGQEGPRSTGAAIAALARRQYGVVARRQLVGAAVAEIGTILHPVHAGVYAAGAA